MPKTITPLSDELKAQWVENKNLPLTKETTSAGSHKKVWWECELGHQWEAQIKARSNGNGCPYCSGRKVLPGVTDLATRYPKMAEQWHPTLNRDLLPSQVTSKTEKKVWWKCAKGHEWEGKISYRTGSLDKDGKAPCPVCLGTIFQKGVNDFATIKPELVRFWSKDNKYSPDELAAKSNKIIIWECELGHKYKTKVQSFVKCSICSETKFESGVNDIATLYPELVQQWDYEGNSQIPELVSARSKSTKYYWLCEKNHSWKASLSELEHGMPCTICTYRVIDSRYNSLSITHPEIVQEWDYEKNELTPDEFSPMSMENVWWKCPLNHSWRGTIGNRVKKNVQCSICHNREILPGFNDLQTKNPQMAKEWSSKNALLASQVGVGSSYHALWECEKGHEFKAYVYSRVNSTSGCPICSNKKFERGENDLQTLYPDLAEEWSSKNSFPPSEVNTGYKEKVWWECPQGHEYDMPVISRTSSKLNCPLCSGRRVVSGINDLFTIKPELEKEWNSKNTISPKTLSINSNTKVWWICDKQHEWKASVQSRTRGRRCPYCTNKKVLTGYNDVFTIKPELKQEWNFEKNISNNVFPENYTYGSKKMVWWKCANNHEWEGIISDRSRGIGCPYCSHLISRSEQEIYDYIVSLGIHAEQSNRKILSGQELDIYVPDKKIAFEYNGLYWHSEEYRTHDYHYNKHISCQEEGIQLIQIWEDDWRDKQDIIKKMISHKLSVSKEQSIYARKLKIDNVSPEIASRILDENHIQGSVEGCHYIGLFDNDTCVAVLAFRLEGKNKKIGNIVRYVTSQHVIGGFNKLLSFLERNYDLSSVYTFSDNEISNGSLYLNSGFEVDKIIPPDYMYVYKLKRYHKFRFRKSHFKKDPDLVFDESLTELELAHLNKLWRVFDSGKIRWVKQLHILG